jgi:hypothetical protein
MARHTSKYTVTDEGRDKGKVFVITEMPAARGEDWAARALSAVMGANPELPDDFDQLGMAALAELGLKSLASLQWEIVKPLFAEMMDCVEIIPDPRKPHVVRAIIEEDIEEIMTRFKLRLEWWTLHMGFLGAVDLSGSNVVATAAARVTRTRTSLK